MGVKHLSVKKCIPALGPETRTQMSALVSGSVLAVHCWKDSPVHFFHAVCKEISWIIMAHVNIARQLADLGMVHC